MQAVATQQPLRRPHGCARPATPSSLAHPQRRRTARQQHVPPVPAAAAGGAAEEQPPIDVRTPVGLPQDGMDPQVAEALQRVQDAMKEAEETIQHLDRLPSARLPSAWDPLLRVLRPLAQFAALAAACAAAQSLGTAARLASSLLVGAAVALQGWRRRSLDPSGAIAAMALGAATLGASYRGGLTLLAFFFASSKITQFGEELKAVDEGHRAGGQRDWKQVLCNALVPAGLALAACYYAGGRPDLPLGAAPAAGAAALAAAGEAGGARLLTALNAAFLGYYACCCGDTWSSELGQLSPEEPRLITSLRPVRRGTNGGVTLLGLAAALAGGLFVGLVFWAATLVSPVGAVGGAGAGGLATAVRHWRLAVLGLGAGLVGSLIDSLLGATIQFTGYNRVTGKITGRPGPDVSPISGLSILDNNMVNAVSASLTAALAGAAAAALL